MRDAIAEVLTPHQRAVLVAITLNDVPIDVLAERRATNRGALYKTLHDARRKLRRATGAGRPRDRRAGGMNSAAVEPAARRPPTEGGPMSTRVAINGFGRIGRAVLRSAIERNAKLEIVAVHDVAPADVLAHLLQHDSVYGRFAHPVRAEAGALVVADRRIQVIEDEGQGLSWGELGVDIVIEATGRLRTRADAARHIEAGARKVIMSAPIKGREPADADLVLGVNFDRVYDLSATTSSATSRALPTASPRWRRCSMKRSASGTAS